MKEFESSRFDVWDPFPGGIVGVVKKKKEMLKQTDFHDPVRESFEAELERVQKMKEQERQQIIEEKERALELARIEEKQRLRAIREQEEERRRLEEEAREAEWKIEQERLEAMRKVEEQRIAREEEKQRMAVEEERRKQAAKQKLIELEERIAKRQAEAGRSGSTASSVADDKLSKSAQGRPTLKMPDFSDWEDSERMVERITTSASSDSSSLTRPFDMGSRPHFPRDNSSALLARSKPVNSWRRDAFENGNSSTFIPQRPQNDDHSSRRDAAVGGSGFRRKGFQGGLLQTDDSSHSRVQRWNAFGVEDNYGKNAAMDTEFNENLSEKCADGWPQGHYPGNSYLSYTDQLYPNPDSDVGSSFGRSRASIRHPRVLPPPSMSSMHKASYRHDSECPSSSTLQENEVEYSHAPRNVSIRQASLDDGHLDNCGQPDLIDAQQEITANREANLDGKKTTPRCGSQCSLYVSSAPDSPVYLSDNDLEEFGNSPALSVTEEGEGVSMLEQDNNPVLLPTLSGKANTSSVFGSDDEEWTADDKERVPEHEFDEDEDGYQDGNEVHVGDDGNINLTPEFEDMHLEDKASPNMDNLVLGFNEGVEVAMPDDDFERSPPDEETTLAVPKISAGIVSEDQEYFDGMHETLKPVAIPSQASTARIFQETEKAVHNLVIQSDSTLQDDLATNGNSVVYSQSAATSSVNKVSLSSSDQTVMPSPSAAVSQAETPVTLQFGLFSGPSLIPSPVPAIQIGSIQMPLLHPQVGSSFSHLHASQPPIFQFGQLRYTSPISQRVLPITPQSAPFVQPSMPGSFSTYQNARVDPPVQPNQETSARAFIQSDALSPSTGKEHDFVQGHTDLSQGNVLSRETSLAAREVADSNIRVESGSELGQMSDNKNVGSKSVFVDEDHGNHNSVVKNFKSMSTKETEGLPNTGAVKDKQLTAPRGKGIAFSGRGRKNVSSVRSKSSFIVSESSRSDVSEFQRRPRRQRTDFRSQENAVRQHFTSTFPANHTRSNDKPNTGGRTIGTSSRGWYRRVGSNKTLRQTNESGTLSSDAVISWEADSESKSERGTGKDSFVESQNASHSEVGILKRIVHSEDDVDVPLQSGVVRIFEQHGIEAPSDEDDFIKVRSKRQMLNDRREQREKEIKAKSRFSKVLQNTLLYILYALLREKVIYFYYFNLFFLTDPEEASFHITKLLCLSNWQ